MADIIAKVIPILLLISLGMYLRYKNILHQSTVDEVKKIVINVALSSVLFLAFINMELKREYFLVSIIIFALLNLFYIIGLGVNKTKTFSHPITPFVCSGFTFGLLGIPLFATVFGVENVGKLSVVGIGHEFYIWIVFYTLMRMRLKGDKLSITTAKEIIKSPLIISIVLGILFNIAGLGEWMQQNPLAKGFYTTIEYLSSLATTLILIIVGFGLKFNRKYMRKSTKFVVLRMMITLIAGYAVKLLIINNIMPRDLMFDYAYFSFLILPPPLSLPIFIGAYSNKEYEELANNTVVLNTVISVSAYIVFVLIVL